VRGWVEKPKWNNLPNAPPPCAMQACGARVHFARVCMCVYLCAQWKCVAWHLYVCIAMCRCINASVMLCAYMIEWLCDGLYVVMQQTKSVTYYLSKTQLFALFASTCAAWPTVSAHLICWKSACAFEYLITSRTWKGKTQSKHKSTHRIL